MSIKNILNTLKNQNILVIGDIILDKYIFADVSRISPEAPIPVALVKREDYKLGGAANTAQNLAYIGINTSIIGIIGGDKDGKKILELLKKNKIDTIGIILDKSKLTIKKLRIIAKNQQMLRLDYESILPLSVNFEKKIFKIFQKKFKKFNSVIISDYAKGALSPSLIESFIKLCNKEKIPIVIDPKPVHRLSYKNATFLTPNLSEAKEMAKYWGEIGNKIDNIGDILSKNLNANIILTRGENGMSIYSKNKNILHIPSFQNKEVYDVTGAGDTVIAFFAACIGIKAPILEAAKIASIAASIAITKLGTAQVSIKEIINLIKNE